MSRTSKRMQLVGQFVVIDIHPMIIEKYAEIQSYLLRTGRTVGDNDGWIAATAAAASALLITTDKDFDPLADKFLRLSRFRLASVDEPLEPHDP